ncbi:YczE/YyaS/YitT family protein [Anaerocolumna xylanovorans]|uniref:Uncharacterized membrane protein YczE n=1 Tax=Anaerocolumna xylanovorans DSM 12503 TaxID=1121345 RepID=A0A1M7YKY5_9FIRM|nr:hypothetical protein [Anaerocolumna xylanovorans]SHO53236.1 Uncharacterized membrane protein YczE [Anaerocolumna xylanovorans DSM 12503]
METQMKFGFKDKKRIFSVIIAVILMGLSLSFLIRLNFGTDPCSAMNLGISRHLHLSFGTWLVLFNFILFILVILFDRSQIGWGTLANMLLVGYSADFFRWLFDFILPDNAFTALSIRIVVLIPSLLIFVLAAAVYMAVDLGSAPYDALSFIIASKLKKIPFRIIRIAWDMTACLIGFLLGSTIGIVTVLIAFLLGPVIAWVKEKINRFL